MTIMCVREEFNFAGTPAPSPVAVAASGGGNDDDELHTL